MRNLGTLLLLILGLLAVPTDAWAQHGSGSAQVQEEEEFIPDAIYEVRYWTNMANMNDTQVYVDTLYYFGDRVSVQYTSANCLSYQCKTTDVLLYKITPKLHREKEWVMEVSAEENEKEGMNAGEYFIRKLHRVNVNFAGYPRTVYKMYVSDMENKDTGRGDYSFTTKEFGIIYRWNADGEIFMLNRIDVVKNGRVRDEIDLLPLHMGLGRTDIFNGSSE